MEGPLPEKYNMLHKTYANVKDNLCDPADDIEGDLEDIGEKESENVEGNENDGDIQDKAVQEKDFGWVEEENGRKGGK